MDPGLRGIFEKMPWVPIDSKKSTKSASNISMIVFDQIS
jgi:hypothetical protein